METSEELTERQMDSRVILWYRITPARHSFVARCGDNLVNLRFQTWAHCWVTLVRFIAFYFGKEQSTYASRYVVLFLGSMVW